MPVNGETRTYRVSGVVDAPGAGLYCESGHARTLAGRDGAVDLIAVTVDSGRDAEHVAEDIRAATGDSRVVVSTEADRGDVEDLESGAARGMLVALSSSLGGTIIMIVAFIVAGALSVSVAGQCRDLALLRAVGATPRQVRRLIATQATLVAGAALIVGIGVGYLLADEFAEAMRAAGMLPSSLPLSWSPLPGAAAGLLLLLVVQLAARGAAMRAPRMSAVEAVAESRVEPRDPAPVRTVVGVALMRLALAGTMVPLITRSEAAFIGAARSVAPAMIGLAMAAPSVVRATTGWPKRRLRPRGPAPTWLAVGSSHGYALRMAGAITVLALAVGLAITHVFNQTTLQAVTDDDRAKGVTVDATVTAEHIGGPSDGDVDAIADQPNVDAAVPLIRTGAVWPFRQDGEKRAQDYSMLALGPDADSVVDVDVVDGDLADLRGDTIALDASTAWMEGMESATAST